MSPFIPGLIVGYALGVASMCGLVGLYLLHRPRCVAPTKRRKYRDAVVEAPKAEAPVEPMYMYGVTGLEE